jgi:hypothetical protein
MAKTNTETNDRDKILSQFSFIKDTPILSEINKEL